MSVKQPPPDPNYKPPGTFQTLEQIREYVSGDRIQCLICGRYYQRLMHAHLGTHHMTHDDYKAAFGIPWTVSLASVPSREATGRLMTPERIEKFMQTQPYSRGTNHRPHAPAVRREWKKNAVLGRYMVRQIVTAHCATCGCPVQTTALAATQPLHCDKCATPRQMSVRRYMRKLKGQSPTAA